MARFSAWLAARLSFCCWEVEVDVVGIAAADAIAAGLDDFLVLEVLLFEEDDDDDDDEEEGEEEEEEEEEEVVEVDDWRLRYQ